MSHDSDDRRRVLDLIANDSSGLLESKITSRKSKLSSASLVERNFREIIDFAINQGHLPQKNQDSVLEYQLATRLENAKNSTELDELLGKLDTTGVLRKALVEESREMEVSSFSDRFNLLANPDASEILNLVHVKANSKLNPSFMSHRTRCLSFYEYKSIFDKIHVDLASKARKLVAFDLEQLKDRSFFVLSGVLGYLAKADVIDGNYAYKSGERSRPDGRTLCIFDNETESKILYRSLVKALQTDGFLISDYREVSSSNSALEDKDQSLGYIYVLGTLNAKLKKYTDLYKIGFTSGLVSSRIANCEKEATYLFSRVRVAATYRCYNINASTVEQQLHKVFESARLDFEIRDAQGNTFRPREWFQVKVKDIEWAIKLAQNKELASYNYHPKYGFVERSEK